MSYKRVVLKWENRFGKHRRIIRKENGIMNLKQEDLRK